MKKKKVISEISLFVDKEFLVGRKFAVDFSEAKNVTDVTNILSTCSTDDLTSLYNFLKIEENRNFPIVDSESEGEIDFEEEDSILQLENMILC